MTQDLMLDPMDPGEPAGPHLVRDTAPPPGRELRVVSEKPRVDLAAAERAAGDFLTALGVDLGGDGLSRTPARMARAYAELFDARPFRLTTFPNEEGYAELVLARDIPFRTVCEHHLLPFRGVAHVGYLPGDAVVGLSKLARLVEHFAARPQTQERLTQQVADCLAARLNPRGAGVMLEAEHACMTLRGYELSVPRRLPRPCSAHCARTRGLARSSSRWPGSHTDWNAREQGGPAQTGGNNRPAVAGAGRPHPAARFWSCCESGHS